MQSGQGIVIDLDFDQQMTETEIKSLCGQLQYCYSSNTHAVVPCHLYFTSLQASTSVLVFAKQLSKQKFALAVVYQILLTSVSVSFSHSAQKPSAYCL